MPNIHSIVIVGLGNVGNAIYTYLVDNDDVKLYYISSKQRLDLNQSKKIEISDLEKFSNSLIVLCIPDDAIQSVSQSFADSSNVIIHTSGTKTLQVLDNHSHSGIWYPLNSFSFNFPVVWSDIPVFTCSNDSITEKHLLQFSELMEVKSTRITETTKEILHLSAVFANNFTNFMITQSAELLESTGLDISIFKTLLNNMVDKLIQLGPIAAQTGPAKRDDIGVINRHLNLLQGHDSSKRIYRLLTDEIRSKYLK
ncbi:MAG: DUF2520 domain-containing protein [Bacteroidota bacterium]|nr:DUF2520 domain-containing protein [Bacteroidota bacterium]